MPKFNNADKRDLMKQIPENLRINMRRHLFSTVEIYNTICKSNPELTDSGLSAASIGRACKKRKMPKARDKCTYGCKIGDVIEFCLKRGYNIDMERFLKLFLDHDESPVSFPTTAKITPIDSDVHNDIVEHMAQKVASDFYEQIMNRAIEIVKQEIRNG